MKNKTNFFKYIVSTVSVLGVFFGSFVISHATSAFLVQQGGTGATTIQLGQLVSGTYSATNIDHVAYTSTATTTLTGTGAISVTSGAIVIGNSPITISCSGCGSGTVTAVTGVYPIQSTGGATPAISIAFGTTTSNTWANTQTFTNSPVFSTIGAGTVNSLSNGTIYNTATSTPSVTSPITYSGTLGQFIGGSSGSFGCATCLTANQTITLSGVVTGSGATSITTAYPNANAGTFLTNATGSAAPPTFVATSSIFGTGTGGQIVAWNNGVPQWVATSSISNGVTSIATNNGITGGPITTTGTIGLATINAGVLGAVVNGAVPTSQATSTLYGTGTGGQVLGWSNATGGLAFIATSSSSGSTFPFTPLTNYGVNTSATTTALWAQVGLFASSSSVYPTLAIQQSSTGMAATFLGGNVGIGTTSPSPSMLSIVATTTSGTIVGLTVSGTQMATTSTASGAAAENIINVVGTQGQGSNFNNASTQGGRGANISVIAGMGGNVNDVNASQISHQAGVGGSYTQTAGRGGDATAGGAAGGNGGSYSVAGGAGGNSVGFSGGSAGGFNLTGGTGGVTTGAFSSGTGGSSSLVGGNGGDNSNASGQAGTGGSFVLDAGRAGTASGGAAAGSNGQIQFGVTNARSITVGNSNTGFFTNFIGKVGLASTTPFGQLSVNPTSANGTAPSFVVGSSTGTTLIVTNAGQVGIGTASPTALFTVNGLASTTNLTISGLGNTSTSCLQSNNQGVVSTTNAACGGGGTFPFTPLTNFGVNTSATTTALWAQAGLFASSTSRIASTTFAINGNVGIGTSSPPTVLAVEQNSAGATEIRTSNFNSAGTENMEGVNNLGHKFDMGGTGSTFNIAGMLTSDVAYIYSDHAGGLGIMNNSASGFVRFGAGGVTEQMRLTAAGRLGIGTSLPGALLTVNLNTSTPTTTPAGAIAHFIGLDAANSFFTVDSFGTGVHSDVLFRHAVGTEAAATAEVADGIMGQIQTRGYDGTAYVAASRAAIRFTAAENWTTTANGTYMDFLTTPKLSTTQTQAMRIDSTGNVGIGSTTPYRKFSVVGNSVFAGGNEAIEIVGATVANGDWLLQNVDADARFRIYGGGSGNERLTVASSGNVGIATSSPWRTFSVTGTVAFDGLTTSSSLQTGDLCLSSTKDVVSDSVLCVASAARFKEKVNPLDSALAEVLQMKPISFYWKPSFNGALQSDPNYSGEQVGLIADELQKIDGRLITVEATSTEFEGKMYPAGTAHGLNLEGLVGVLVGAVQDIEKQVLSLVQHDKTQDAQIEALKEQVAQLKAQINKK